MAKIRVYLKEGPEMDIELSITELLKIVRERDGYDLSKVYSPKDYGDWLLFSTFSTSENRLTLHGMNCLEEKNVKIGKIKSIYQDPDNRMAHINYTDVTGKEKIMTLISKGKVIDAWIDNLLENRTYNQLKVP